LFGYTIKGFCLRIDYVTKHDDMPKTFTLPENLETQMTALTGHEPCDLLFQSQMMNNLAEEFENVSFSPSQSSIDKVLAYSKAVEVKKSDSVIENHVMIMN